MPHRLVAPAEVPAVVEPEPVEGNDVRPAVGANRREPVVGRLDEPGLHDVPGQEAGGRPVPRREHELFRARDGNAHPVSGSPVSSSVFRPERISAIRRQPARPSPPVDHWSCTTVNRHIGPSQHWSYDGRVMGTTLIRATLVPAFMRLAGEANWWAPRPLKRFYDRYGISESEAAPPSPSRAEPELEPTG
jgi:hypothetical protein